MTLVSVVGDFDSGILPLFYYHAELIEVHILLHAPEDIQKAERLQSGLRRFCRRYDYDPLLVYIPYDETSEKNIEDVADRILKYSGARKLLINATEGLTSTALLLHSMLVPYGGLLTEYDRKANRFSVIEDGKIRSECVSPMTVEEHLILKNIAVDLYPDMQDVMKRKLIVEKLFSDSERFMAFRNVYGKTNGEVKGFDDIKALLDQAGLYDTKNFIDGGIFEEVCFHLLNELPFDDVQMGAVVTFMPDTSKAYFNEFDILCIKDNHLHIVECKFRHRLDGEELVYKYDALMDLMDDDGRAVLAVVGGDNESIGKSGKVKKSFHEGSKRRADDNDMLIYHERRFDPERFKRSVASYLLS